MKEKPRVLVVDDDRRMVKTICDILKVKGYEALTAFTGKEAVELVRAGGPDCVLMDIRMPGMDGISALTAMKELRPDIPVVLMSAYATDEMAAEARRLGAYTVLTKPIDVQIVLSFLSILSREESILIVDDDPAFCRTLGDILRSRDYRVLAEMDPDKVLGHMEQNYKLVVILDLKLGNVNGLDILKSIRARYPEKPVVLVTGYKEEMAETIEKGMSIGAYTCLYKPLEANELITLVEDISRKKLRKLIENQR